MRICEWVTRTTEEDNGRRKRNKYVVKTMPRFVKGEVVGGCIYSMHKHVHTICGKDNTTSLSAGGEVRALI